MVVVYHCAVISDELARRGERRGAANTSTPRVFSSLAEGTPLDFYRCLGTENL